ncbi:hypothetical protein BDY21DRAFT_343241 [Lineolata rhizophorae]|uniref:CsbD-like domain-containing protein n=1 Tax=Lineolata rhizophorae TaxID=578093 RepID=A0A6A6P2E6_9PEZI|nr:hypothetical protein BDY21DRAFT_343241 [Lineolata rhizophorae]
MRRLFPVAHPRDDVDAGPAICGGCIRLGIGGLADVIVEMKHKYRIRIYRDSGTAQIRKETTERKYPETPNRFLNSSHLLDQQIHIHKPSTMSNQQKDQQGNILGGVTDTVGKGVGGVTNTLGETVGTVGKGVGDTASGVTQGIGDTTKGVGNTAQGATNKAGETFGGKKQTGENPLGL